MVGVDIEQYDEKRAHKYLRGLWQKETDLSIVNAYRSYFSIVASAPINFMNFTRNVNEYRQKPPFNFTNPLANVGGIVQVTTRDDENLVVTFRFPEFKEFLNSYNTKLGLQFQISSYLCNTLASFLESFHPVSKLIYLAEYCIVNVFIISKFHFERRLVDERAMPQKFNWY